MRLVPKLALALLAGVFIVVAGFTAFRVSREIKAYDEDVRRDQRIVGVTAGAALAKTRTREEAIKLAQRVNASRDNITISYVSLADVPDPQVKPLVDFRSRAPLDRGEWVQVVERLEDANHLVTYVGAPVVDDTRGAIQLAQSLAPRAAYVWRGFWNVFASSVAMLLVCAVIVSIIGAKMVGQPVSELIGAARRIGEGHFETVGPVVRKDEFGELARAMRSMSEGLAAARQRMNDETEARIRALEQLRHAERLATLGQLASVLAHEIGTPLNVIAGHAKMIATRRLQGAGAFESAAAIGTQCERMTGIVRRILDYARRRPPRRALIDATEIVQQVGELLTGLAEQRRVTLSLEKRAGSMQLLADSDQLRQAMTNLVLNAIQASEPDQEVRVSTTLGSVPNDTAPAVVFTVEDHGQGIAAEDRQRIFEPFFTTKPPGEGTGLGLSVVRDIVQEHGGTVDVSTEPGQGSVFKLYFPREAANAEASTDR